MIDTSFYQGKKVLVVGFGKSGVATVRFLDRAGARILVTDKRSRPELMDFFNQCLGCKFEVSLGGHQREHFLGADLIVVSPGVPLSLDYIQEAKHQGVPITNEIEMAAQYIKEPLVAITGTNGKTTTTILLGEILKAAKEPVFVGGNIGNPLLNYVLEKKKAKWVIVELSSFQLEIVQSLKPVISIFTNIDQDHLDRYANFDQYIQAKKRLLYLTAPNAQVILNLDDPFLIRFAEETAATVWWFTRRDPKSFRSPFSEHFKGTYYQTLTRNMFARLGEEEESYDVSSLKFFGDHNKENAMAALLAARLMKIAPSVISQVFQTIEGVSHRLEFIRKKGGVFFINDSKATNVASLYRSLSAFEKNPIILIAGGRDKGMDFNPLVDLVKKRVKILILVGEAKEKINRVLGDYSETFLVGTLEEAVLLAYHKSRKRDIILLSPGCSSYDSFKNYEERGQYFKKLVFQL